LTFSFELLVMCNEVIGQIRRLMEGIKVDSEHLALDAIKRVGPGGHFLGDDHTFKHFRDNWMPDITDRKTYETWLANGGTTMRERARAKVKYILENHKPEPLDKEVDLEISRILEAVESRA
ncbi:trimethylamine methyltransferase family protein, partial [Desulfofundulus sp.]|uniref:trimethylamine methyltransferase family protein n=1 Tax=Desulfofundulus sp. TaxID=2282750 RepID=UPI003C7924E0